MPKYEVQTNLYDTWKSFWDSLDSDEKVLFRLLQSAHRELGKNVQMFYYGYMNQKNQIEKYVTNRFNVDLNKLPQLKSDNQ